LQTSQNSHGTANNDQNIKQPTLIFTLAQKHKNQDKHTKLNPLATMTNSSTTGAKYDMRFNPVYQVDCQIAASGKYFAATKRRIQWKFGFSDCDSIAKGMSGMNCRGEEHEVVLVWSLTSGKQLVLADGHEVHFASARLSDKFETSWTMKGGHMIKLIAYAAPPLFPTTGFRQFDLLIDGLSYWDMPKIFQLGKPKTMNAMRARSSPMSYSNYTVSADEPHFGRRPNDLHSSMPNLVTESHDIAPTQRMPAQRSHSMPRDLMSVDLLTSPLVGGVQDHLAPSNRLDSPTSVMDEFSPQAPSPPSFQDKANQILDVYQTPTVVNSHSSFQSQPVNPNASYAAAPTQTYAILQQSYYAESVEVTYAQGHVEVASNHITPSMMTPLSLEVDARDDSMTEIEKALKSLVNLEDISREIETPQQLKFKEQRQASGPAKGKPKPPTTPEWFLGQNASLAEIKAHQAPTAKAPFKEIMKIHAFDPAAVHAGMMVVYGAPSPHHYGGGHAIYAGH
jgi:hypothetical protein